LKKEARFKGNPLRAIHCLSNRRAVAALINALVSRKKIHEVRPFANRMVLGW
jgi:hypothetical protein